METTLPPTDEDEDAPIDVPLWPHQMEAVYRIDAYRWVNEIGGRGSGKTYKDKVRIVRWAEMCTELPWGIFAPTEEMLQSALQPIRECIEDMGINHVYGTRVPEEWIEQWERDGVRYPAPRLRTTKFWVWDTGAHFFTGSIINNAYTRAKGIDFNGILGVEITEPGVTLKAIMTLFGGLRCGKAQRGEDGIWRCNEPGHLHTMVLEGNVPLNDPRHWIYKKNRQMLARENVRKIEGKPPFYRLITSATTDNPATGADYDDGLRSMFDPATYIEQTRGVLEVNTEALTYHSFGEKNILRTLTYDPKRPLYMWFDWNATPATAGWGHDLRPEEVPEIHRRRGHDYFGIVGEFFSGNDAITTDRVAAALLAEGERSGICVDCHHELARVHIEMPNGFLCAHCSWRKPGVTPTQHCSGVSMSSSLSKETTRKYIHAPANWRGLMRHRGMIYVYGDANDGRGTGASVSGGSIQILRDAFADALGERVEFRIGASNPRIVHRLLAVNRGFEDAHHVASVFVADWCEAHLADFREVIPDPETGEPLKKKRPASGQRVEEDDYSLRTHSSDGFGYHWHARHPVIIPKSDGMPLGPEDDYEGPRAWART